ncbi:MAG: site-2 protease family protein [Oscillospiraceae bacterium]|jgi:regulator of sigma E protease|nr:site-2 protease family protein [Oscillospiraceae bacterium]
MYIVLAILAFGFIITIHELGHYLSAKALNVKVNEFAVGFGPKIFRIYGKETLYSLRALPFGGFCSFEGEHKEGDEPDPRSFFSQSRLRRVIILAAGSFANFIAAFIIILILTAGADGFMGTTIVNVSDKFPDAGLAEIMPGDRLVAINGERLFYYEDYVLFLRLNADNPITFTLDRNGEKVEYQRRTHMVDGEEHFRYSIAFNSIDGTILEKLKYSCYRTYSFVRLIRISILMMVNGSAGVENIAGPVGVVDAMNTIGQQAPTTSAAIGSIVFFTAFLGVNIGMINMLPIPAMDGGRILFIFVSWVIEKITRRSLNPKYEGYINTGAFVLLIGIMVIALYNDIIRIVSGG